MSSGKPNTSPAFALTASVAAACVHAGKGNLRGLATGCTFHLENHPVKQANAEYLVVSTTVDIRNVDETSSPVGNGARYQCETSFALQPANTFFKNRLKNKPPMC